MNEDYRVLRPSIRLDSEVCARVGALLAEHRTQMGLSRREVAERLLLSPSQVRCLETADVSAFHNPDYFARAAERYLHLVAVPLGVSRAMLLQPLPSPAKAGRGYSVLSDWRLRHDLSLAFVVALLGLALVLLLGSASA